jgi:hypothetical protein
MTISILRLIAIVLFLLSVVVAIMTGQALNPLWLMVASFAVLTVFAGVIP